VSFGYDMASDHNTSSDDGTTHVAETLSKTGRVLRRVVTASVGGAAISDTSYGYSGPGDSPAYEETTGTTTPLTTYLPNGGVDVAGVATYRHFNNHGDLVGTSTSTGAWTDVTPGDEYGLETTSRADRMSWLGQQQRQQVGIANLTRMGVRLYEPTSGRFLSVDPIDGGSANNYDYVAGDPINRLDLDGMCWGGHSKCSARAQMRRQMRYARAFKLSGEKLLDFMGVTDPSLRFLIMHESSGRTSARAGSHLGLGQLSVDSRLRYLGATDRDTLDPWKQLAAMRSYIKDRYGTAARAKDAWIRHCPNWPASQKGCWY
jgi:RHS repeat-associated protein